MLDVNFFAKFLNLSQKEDILLKLYIKNKVTKEEVYHLLYDFDYNIEKEKLTFNFLLWGLSLSPQGVSLGRRNRICRQSRHLPRTVSSCRCLYAEQPC